MPCSREIGLKLIILVKTGESEQFISPAEQAVLVTDQNDLGSILQGDVRSIYILHLEENDNMIQEI